MHNPAPVCCALLAPLLASACVSPLGGEDLEVTAAGSALPGVGASLGFAQRIDSDEHRRIDLELDWTYQKIDSAVSMGRTGDSLDRVRFGFRMRFDPASEQHATTRFGVTWLRAQGDPKYLDQPGDYGGIYAGFGYEFEFAPHWVTGPEVVLHLYDSEGSGDSGWVPELAWRLGFGL